jgi:hypothetical protein
MRALLAGILLDMGELRRGQAVLEEAERLDPEGEMVQAVRQILESMKKSRTQSPKGDGLA